MPSTRAFRIATWTAAAVLAPVILLYAASFLFTFSRISLSGITVKLDRGRVAAYWLSTPTPWRVSIPAPGWHVQRGPVGFTFKGQGAAQGTRSPMYGPRSAAFRLEYYLIPFTLGWLALHRFTRPHPSGHCRRCGYDQSGLPPQAPCPECGAARSLVFLLARAFLRHHERPELS